MQRLPRLAALFAVFLLATAIQAQGLAVKDVVGLLKLGYTEAEVREEVQRAGQLPPLSPDDVAALRAAGATDGLIAFLQGAAGAAPAAPARDAAEILKLVQEGKSTGEILERIAAARGAWRLTPEAAVELTRAGAPLAVLLALKGQPLTLEGVAQLAADRLGAEDFLRLLSLLGAEAAEVPAARALELGRAGVPIQVIRAFRPGAAPPAGTDRPAGPAQVEPRFFATAPIPGGVYTHPGRCFRIRCPEDWVLARDLWESKTRFVFTPEKDKKSVEELQAGISVSIDPVEKGSLFTGKSALAILEHLRPMIQVLEPDMRLEGEVGPAKLGRLDAARMVLVGRPRDRQGDHRAEVYLAEKDGLVYTVAALALVDRFAEAKPLFDRILAESEFGNLAFARRQPAAMDDNELVRKYKGSVVYVETDYGGLGQMGQGTGFIISREGYLLTNWHVVWDMENDKPGKSFTVHWDDSLKRPPVKAELLGVEQRRGRSGAAIGGVDVALLKIPPGDYQPVPLTPASEVELGDPVMAMGFPKSFELTGLSLFITKGVMVRFNRGLDGNLESLTTDAKITHGSSGGPCFDLKTGGVIGLNTWGNKQEDYAGYSFLCPIDAALARFPMVAGAGGIGEGGLDFLDAYDLARIFLNTGGVNDAVKLAGWAAEAETGSASARALLGAAQQNLAFDYLGRGNKEAAEDWFRKARRSFDMALERNQDNQDALVGLTVFLLLRNELDEAGKYAARLVRAHPNAWGSHFLAGRVAMTGRRFVEALGHLARAKDVSRGIIPLPFVLAGEVHYADGKLEEGRQEFLAAAQIHPSDLNARLGAVRYFELKREWDRAIEEYTRLLGDFPRHFVVNYRIGLCHRNKGDVDEAAKRYLLSAQAMETAGEVAPGNFYLEYGEILEKKGATTEAVRQYAEFLANYGETPEVVDAHLKAAALYVKENVAVLATAHHRLAEILGPKFNRQVPAAGFQPQALDVAGIKLMFRFKYPPMVVKDIVENNRLSVNIAGAVQKAAQENNIRELNIQSIMPILQKIGQELELPPQVVLWMFNSNLKNPPEAGQGLAQGGGQGLQGQGGGPRQPAPPSPLLGGWEAQGMIPNVGFFRTWTVLRPDGTFEYKTQIGGYYESGTGRYSIDQDFLTQTFDNTGRTFKRRLQVVGRDQIKIHFAEFNDWMTMGRSSPTPPTWW